MKKAAFALLLAALGCAERAARAPVAAVPAAPLLTYCQLASAPAAYAGREVRVVGIFRTGFEWSELYSPQCPDAGDTWVEWIGYHRCTARAKPKTLRFGSSEGTFGLIARGTLRVGGEGFGHLNAYAFELDVDCAERLQLLAYESFHQHALTAEMRRAIARFEARYPGDAAASAPPR